MIPYWLTPRSFIALLFSKLALYQSCFNLHNYLHHASIYILMFMPLPCHGYTTYPTPLWIYPLPTYDDHSFAYIHGHVYVYYLPRSTLIFNLPSSIFELMRDFSFTKDDDVIINVVVLLELFDLVSRM
jgi:hypothetical protein